MAPAEVGPSMFAWVSDEWLWYVFWAWSNKNMWWQGLKCAKDHKLVIGFHYKNMLVGQLAPV